MKTFAGAVSGAALLCAPCAAEVLPSSTSVSAAPAAAAIAAPATMPAPTATPMVVGTVAPTGQTTLPANSEVLLAVNSEVTSKRNHEGDTFDLSVVHDVVNNGQVVIPRGSRAVGEITWLTTRGAFGKSGKMNIELRYVEVGGRRIPISGSYRQEGEGATVATVGTVILVGVFAAFVTGKSALIPQGRELMAHTKEDLPYVVASASPAPAPMVIAPGAPIPAVIPASATAQVR